jgi:hypothetical protein
MSTGATDGTCPEPVPGQSPLTCPTCGSDIPSRAQLIADARHEVEGHGADPDALCCPSGTFAAGTWAAHVLAKQAELDALRAERDELAKACDLLRDALGITLDIARKHDDYDAMDDQDRQVIRAALAKEPTRG